jgi:hypothetical protein
MLTPSNPTPAPFFPNKKQGPGKKWEKPVLAVLGTKNGKPAFQPVHVRTGDTVQVVTGSDKGKVGPIFRDE